ncbi:MAG: hypothetical protein ACRCXX_11415 [Cetobacterium sp.]|uniref:hypothetical protein n=1 Tax=Cetobacterium sp. TaxID=2071632 RepID=UPI003F32206C
MNIIEKQREMRLRINRELNESYKAKEYQTLAEQAEAESERRSFKVSKAETDRINSSKRVRSILENQNDIKLNIITEAICKHILAAMPLDEEVKAKVRHEVFGHVKSKFANKIGDKNFMENLRSKSNLLENLIDQCIKCEKVTIARMLKEAKGEAPEAYSDPVSLLTGEEDAIISTDNTSTDAIPAEDLHEIITDKVIKVIEDETARAEEDELIIADIKNNVQGGLDAEEEMEVSEALNLIRGTLFTEFVSAAQKDKFNLSEGVSDKQTEVAIAEAIVYYTICETLYTLRIFE